MKMPRLLAVLLSVALPAGAAPFPHGELDALLQEIVDPRGLVS